MWIYQGRVNADTWRVPIVGMKSECNEAHKKMKSWSDLVDAEETAPV